MGTHANTARPATALPAVAAILVLVAAGSIQVRLDPAPGWVLLLYIVAAVIIVPWALAAVAAERGDERPSGTTTALLLASLWALLTALLSLVEALGADGGPGSTLIVSLVFAALAGVPGWRMNSPICALLSSAALGVAFLALIDLVGSIDSLETFRWLLLILAIAYAAAAAVLLRRRYRHAVQHVSAAGIAVGGLVLISFGTVIQGVVTSTFLNTGGSLSFNGPLGWELIGILAAGAVIAFAVVFREPGPGWIGVFALTFAVTLAAFPQADPSLIGWPIVLILVALAAVAAVFLSGAASLPSGLAGLAGSRGPGGSGAAPSRAREDRPAAPPAASEDRPPAPTDRPWSDPPSDPPPPPPPSSPPPR